MEGTSSDHLQQAEKLLREGRKQAALPLLAEYLSGNPDSARAWWMLSYAVPDLKRQIDCLEKVLQLEPENKTAQARLEKIKASAPSQTRVAPFVEEEPKNLPAASGPVSQPVPASDDAHPKTAPQKKQKNQVMQYSILAVMACCALGLMGAVGMTMLQGRAAPLPAESEAGTGLPLPATWTPTITATFESTRTPFPDDSLLTPSPTPTVEETPVPTDMVGPLKGYYAPDFKLVNVNDDRKTRLSDYKGQAVIIFFWATWCDYCDIEVAALEMLYKTYKDEGLVVLAVDVNESPFYARSYRDRHSMTFPILDDPESKVYNQYRVTGLPTHFFVERSGVISAIRVGFLDYWNFNRKVHEMLDLPPT